jgi:hypothetical protein
MTQKSPIFYTKEDAFRPCKSSRAKASFGENTSLLFVHRESKLFLYRVRPEFELRPILDSPHDVAHVPQHFLGRVDCALGFLSDRHVSQDGSVHVSVCLDGSVGVAQGDNRVVWQGADALAKVVLIRQCDGVEETVLGAEVDVAQEAAARPQLTRADGRHGLTEVAPCEGHESSERAAWVFVCAECGIHVRAQRPHAHKLHLSLCAPGAVALAGRGDFRLDALEDDLALWGGCAVNQ